MSALGPNARHLLDLMRETEAVQRLSEADRAKVRSWLARRGYFGDSEHGSSEPSSDVYLDIDDTPIDDDNRDVPLSSEPQAPEPLVSRRAWSRVADRLRVAVAAGLAVAFGAGAPVWASAGLWFAAGAGASAMAVAYGRTQIASNAQPGIDSSRKPRSGSRWPSRALPTNRNTNEPPGVIPDTPPTASAPPVDAHPLSGSMVESRRMNRPATPQSRTLETASSAPDNRLAEEAALLRSVQYSIRDRDGVRAFALLDEYAARFPNGALLVESRAARVVATCELYDKDRGRVLADQFGRAWPDSPLRARIAVACGER